MGLIMSDDGNINAAAQVRAWMNTNGVYIRLFRNDYSPTVNSLFADFTEAIYGGYASIQKNDYATPVTAGNITTIQPTPAYFSHNGVPIADGIFGYFVTDASNVLLWSERIVAVGASPIDMTIEGATIVVIAKRTFQSKNT